MAAGTLRCGGRKNIVVRGATALGLEMGPAIGRQTRGMLSRLNIPVSATVSVCLGRVSLANKVPFSISLPGTPMSVRTSTVAARRVRRGLRGNCGSVTTKEIRGTTRTFTGFERGR